MNRASFRHHLREDTAKARQGVGRLARQAHVLLRTSAQRVRASGPAIALARAAHSAMHSERTGPVLLALAGALGLIAFLVLPTAAAGSHTRTGLQVAATGGDGSGILWLFALCWIICVLVAGRALQMRTVGAAAAMERLSLARWLCSTCLVLGLAMPVAVRSSAWAAYPGWRVMLLAAALGSAGAWQAAWIEHRRSRSDAVAADRALPTPLVVRLAPTEQSWRVKRPDTGLQLSLARLGTRLFGPPMQGTNGPVAASDALVVPANRLQTALTRRFPMRYVASPWLMAAIGALVALVLGMVLTVAIQPLWQGAVSTALDLLAATGSRGLYASTLAPAVLAPDPILLFAAEHHIGVVARATVGVTGLLPGSLTLTLPLCAVLSIPAFSLTVGGYLSAASAFGGPARGGSGRHLSACVARGALVGPFYALFLLAVAALALHSVHAQVPGLGARLIVGPSLPQSIGYGALWGVLFGALGGWLQWTGRGATSAVRTQLRAASVARTARSAGGACVAAAGILLSFALITLAVTLYLITQTSVASAPGGGPGSTVAQALGAEGAPAVVFLALVLAPAIAVYAAAFFVGAPLDLDAYGQPTTTASLAHGAYLVAPAVLALLCLIPIVWCFVGGRVAARWARPRTHEEAAASGASIALPLGLVLGTLAVCVSLALDISFSGQSSASEAGTMGVHLSVLDTFAYVCVAALLCGAAGGMSVVAVPDLGHRLARAFWPLQQVEARLFPLLDRVTAQPEAPALSVGRQWLYNAVLVAAELCLLVLVLDMASIILAPIVPVAVLSAVQGGVVALLFVLPVICLLVALAHTLHGHGPPGALQVPVGSRRWSAPPTASSSQPDRAVAPEESGDR